MYLFSVQLIYDAENIAVSYVSILGLTPKELLLTVSSMEKVLLEDKIHKSHVSSELMSVPIWEHLDGTNLCFPSVHLNLYWCFKSKVLIIT